MVGYSRTKVSSTLEWSEGRLPGTRRWVRTDESAVWEYSPCTPKSIPCEWRPHYRRVDEYLEKEKIYV
jgi:hypothetical protein